MAGQGQRRGYLCACGAQYLTRSQLIGHGLAVYPPHADRPLDGNYHAPAGEDAVYRMAREYKKAHTALVRLLSCREHVPAGLAADLEAITVELAVMFDPWEQTSWAFDPRGYLRTAAALAFDIASGDCRPGTRASVRAVAGWYRVPDPSAGKAIAKLVECGMLTRRGGHRSAHVACTKPRRPKTPHPG